MGKGGKTIAEMREKNPNFDRDLERTFHLATPKEPNAADLIKTYHQLDDWLTAEQKRFTEHCKPVREQLDAIKSKVRELLISLGSKDKQKISTDYGTAYTSTITTPKISEKGPPYVNSRKEEVLGRDAYLDFCMDHWDEVGNEMLQLGAPQVTAVKNYMEEHDGMLPPGVEISTFIRVNINRS